MKRLFRVLVSAICVFVAVREVINHIPRSWAQQACTIQTVATLKGFFADNVPAYAITPSNIRDFLCSSVNFSLTPTGSGLTDTIGNFLGDIIVGNPTTVSGNFTTLATNRAFTPASTYGIVGTTAADNANTGSFGEYQTAASSAVNVASGTPTTPTGGSVSLTAGDWEIWAYCSYAPATTATMTQIACGANTTSATFGAFFQNIQLTSGDFPVTTGQNLMSAPVRVSNGSSFTAYLVCQSTFGNPGTVGCSGSIFARRIR
jgi:hypothetical protein